MSFNSSIADFVANLKNGSKDLSLRKVRKTKFNDSLVNLMLLSGYFTSKKYSNCGKYIELTVSFIFDSFINFQNIKIVSKSGRRVYATVEDLKKYHLGNKFLFIAVSTSKGVVSSKEAIESKIGGEVVFLF